MSRADIDTLVKMSRSVGEDPELTAGAGGNTSVKDARGKTMYVKASGTSLAGMARDSGWVQVNIDPVREILEDRELAALPQSDRDEKLRQRLMAALTENSPKARPSVETFLHSILDRYVVHTHPEIVCGMLSSKNGADALADEDTLVLPYLTPGYPLSLRIAREVRKWRRERDGATPSVILMGNHGLITTAGKPEEAIRLTRRILQKAGALVSERADKQQVPGSSGPPLDTILRLRGAVYRVTGRHQIVRFEDSGATRRILSLQKGASVITTPLVPEQIAYCGMAPMILRGDEEKAVRKYSERFDHSPKIAVIPDAGFAAIGLSPKDAAGKAEIWAATETMLETTLLFGGPRGMKKADAEYIASWEGEAYRRGLLEAGCEGMLNGRVAAVTGAGSGLGRGIAMGFLEAGACVVMLDLSEKRLNDSLSEAEDIAGPGRALAVRADVTSEEEMHAAMAGTVLEFGGLDILCNAAGIAPSHPLVDFPVEDFRRTLELNLTGYFIAAGMAARLMIKQGAGGSIINISSKTGLEASKNNSAYNATKAGELHLARGWALELGRHNIRVNSIAPGNVFEGSMIWNEEYIKACAKKRGIKPEEVIPYYTSLTALNREIKPVDVANAAVFLASDMASKITGQTIVPDAGQVFVR